MREQETREAQAEIRALLKEKKAILLAHNYQPGEVQDAADLCGDSLELSRKAAKTDAQIIVFAGVHFMAETASILSPDKTVLLPNKEAGCLMADMITAEGLLLRKQELPGVPVVTYVNSPAEAKAHTDVCCTSANVVSVVNALDAPELLLAPDKNLAMYAARHTKKKIHIWDGFCPVHERLSAEDARAAKEAHPGATFMAHPECRPEVIDRADVVKSTSGMLAHPETSPAREFIVATETGILHPMRKRYPDRVFYPAAKHMVCKNMKRISLGDIIRSLREMSGEVRVPEAVRAPALAAVERMIRI
jgi:quinolinate synthase